MISVLLYNIDMTNFSRETSACFHDQCGLCTMPLSKKPTRSEALAAWAVDIGIDRITAGDGVATAPEISRVARELASDYGVPELHGNIAGAIVLGLAGDCTSKQFEMEDLVKE